MTPPFRSSIAPAAQVAIGSETHPHAGSPQTDSAALIPGDERVVEISDADRQRGRRRSVAVTTA
jgi:hypothetical protein